MNNTVGRGLALAVFGQTPPPDRAAFMPCYIPKSIFNKKWFAVMCKIPIDNTCKIEYN